VQPAPVGVDDHVAPEHVRLGHEGMMPCCASCPQ
jgi:hypothetical protein